MSATQFGCFCPESGRLKSYVGLRFLRRVIPAMGPLDGICKFEFILDKLRSSSVLSAGLTTSLTTADHWSLEESADHSVKMSFVRASLSVDRFVRLLEINVSSVV